MIEPGGTVHQRALEIPLFTSDQRVINVLPDPEFEHTPRVSIAHFFGQRHKISNASNRMGYRLDTKLPGFVSGTESISSGVVPGTIQLTNAGQPIILLADAQTSGGYHRLANVLTPDIDVLAQCQPGDEISFHLVDLLTAQSVLRDRAEEMKILLGS